METARKDKRKYEKRTPEERKQLLQARLATLETFHERQRQLIEKLRLRLNGSTSL